MSSIKKIRKWIILFIPIFFTMLCFINFCSDDNSSAPDEPDIPLALNTLEFYTTSSYISVLPPFDLEVIPTCGCESGTTTTQCTCMVYTSKVTLNTSGNVVTPKIDLTRVEIKNNKSSSNIPAGESPGPYSPPTGQNGPKTELYLMPTSTFDDAAIYNGTGHYLGDFDFFGTAEASNAIGPTIYVTPNYLPNSPVGGWYIYVKITNNVGDYNSLNDYAMLTDPVVVTDSGNDYYAFFTTSEKDVDTFMILFDSTVATDDTVRLAANRPLTSNDELQYYFKQSGLVNHIISFYQSQNVNYAVDTTTSSSILDYSARENANSADLSALEASIAIAGLTEHSASVIKRLESGKTYYLRVQKSPYEEKTPDNYNYSLKYSKVKTVPRIIESKGCVPDLALGLAAVPTPGDLTSAGASAYDLNTLDASNNFQVNTSLGADGKEVHWYKILIP